MSESEIQSAFKEAKLLSLASHPNILKLHKIYASKRFLFLVTDLATGGSLKTFIRLRQITRQPITDEESSEIIKQILTGLAHLHNLKIVHRDIKTKNILIEQTKDNKLHIIIADMGLSTELLDYEINFHNQRVGTVNFMAPEQLKGEKITTVFFIF